MVTHAPAYADIQGGSEEEMSVLDLPSAIRAGQLEVTPVLSMSLSGDNLVYRVGATVGYALTRFHQIGGSFVVGNRLYDRVNNTTIGVSAPAGGIGARGLSFDDGFGASLSGYYRYNIPLKIGKRTFPFMEAFGGRDYWGWGNVSEAGAGAGVRKTLSSRTAVTSQYSFAMLFSQGETFPRHLLTVGVSMMFR
jgi:hypothetical protein